MTLLERRDIDTFIHNWTRRLWLRLRKLQFRGFANAKLADVTRGIYRRFSMRQGSVSDEGRTTARFCSVAFSFFACRKTSATIPGRPVAYWVRRQHSSVYFSTKPLGRELADPRAGMATGDNDRFLRLWCEVDFRAIGFGSARAGCCHSRDRNGFRTTKEALPQVVREQRAMSSIGRTTATILRSRVDRTTVAVSCTI